jgi:hypothetical protein
MTKKPGAIFTALVSTLTFATTAHIAQASEAPSSSTKTLIAEVTKQVESDKIKVLVLSWFSVKWSGAVFS